MLGVKKYHKLFLVAFIIIAAAALLVLGAAFTFDYTAQAAYGNVGAVQSAAAPLSSRTQITLTWDIRPEWQAPAPVEDYYIPPVKPFDNTPDLPASFPINGTTVRIWGDTPQNPAVVLWHVASWHFMGTSPGLHRVVPYISGLTLEETLDALLSNPTAFQLNIDSLIGEITPAPLTITDTNPGFSREFDGSTDMTAQQFATRFTITGAVGSDSIAFNPSAWQFQSRNVGVQYIVHNPALPAFIIMGGSMANYTVLLPNGDPLPDRFGAAIYAREIIFEPNPARQQIVHTFDGTTTIPNDQFHLVHQLYRVAGNRIVSGDTLQITGLTTANTVFANHNVGSVDIQIGSSAEPITQERLSSQNYRLSGGFSGIINIPNGGRIDPRSVEIRLRAEVTRHFDGTAEFHNINLPGLFEVITGIAGQELFIYAAHAQFNSANVTTAANVTTLDLIDIELLPVNSGAVQLGNFSWPATYNFPARITPRPIRLVTQSHTIVEGNDFPLMRFTLAPGSLSLVEGDNGDWLGGVVQLENTPGVFPITLRQEIIADLPNYEIIFEGEFTLTIRRLAPLVTGPGYITTEFERPALGFKPGAAAALGVVTWANSKFSQTDIEWNYTAVAYSIELTDLDDFDGLIAVHIILSSRFRRALDLGELQVAYFNGNGLVNISAQEFTQDGVLTIRTQGIEQFMLLDLGAPARARARNILLGSLAGGFGLVALCLIGGFFVIKSKRQAVPSYIGFQSYGMDSVDMLEEPKPKGIIVSDKRPERDTVPLSEVEEKRRKKAKKGRLW